MIELLKKSEVEIVGSTANLAKITTRLNNYLWKTAFGFDHLVNIRHEYIRIESVVLKMVVVKLYPVENQQKLCQRAEEDSVSRDAIDQICAIVEYY